MADIEGLKKRIELIDLRLKTAHSARERESAALMEMWEQIRDRFTRQGAEIETLRERIAALESTRDDLQSMVHALLAAVETGLERMSDETVPQIREMARGLLGANELDHAPSGFPQAPAESEDAPNDDTDFLNALERSMMSAETDDWAYEDEDEDETASAQSAPPDEASSPPQSPGILDLINRVGEPIPRDEPQGPDAAPVDESAPPAGGLTQDMLEIEHLRKELLGLRERISGKVA